MNVKELTMLDNSLKISDKKDDLLEHQQQLAAEAPAGNEGINGQTGSENRSLANPASNNIDNSSNI